MVVVTRCREVRRSRGGSQNCGLAMDTNKNKVSDKCRGQWRNGGKVANVALRMQTELFVLCVRLVGRGAMARRTGLLPLKWEFVPNCVVPRLPTRMLFNRGSTIHRSNTAESLNQWHASIVQIVATNSLD